MNRKNSNNVEDEILTQMKTSELPEQEPEKEAVKFSKLDDSEHGGEHR